MMMQLKHSLDRLLTKTLMLDLLASTPLPVDAVARHATIVANVTQQMIELRALRRAVCLQMALCSSERGETGY